MEIARVIGTVVATQKDALIEGQKLLILEALNPDNLSPKNLNFVGIDIVDAGVGDIVLVVRGSSARVASGLSSRPVDASIVAVIDEIVVGNKSVFKKK